MLFKYNKAVYGRLKHKDFPAFLFSRAYLLYPFSAASFDGIMEEVLALQGQITPPTADGAEPAAADPEAGQAKLRELKQKLLEHTKGMVKKRVKRG